jgi:hypothetical protein
MTDKSALPYKEFITCEPSADQGLVFIKVVAMPYEDAIEFDVAQARAFAQRILAAVAVVESGWVGRSSPPPDTSDT